MLKLIENGTATAIGQDDYCIDEKDTGLDLLTFSLPRGHPLFGRIREETEIDEEQPYIIKQVTSDEQNMDITCELDVDDWKADILEHVILHDNTMHQMIEFCLPSGWAYQDETTGNDGVDELLNDGGTRLEILTATKDIWNITFRFDSKNKVLHIIDPTAGSPCGAYLTRELNLRSVNYTGNTDKFCTRLYCYGKGGMTFEDINDKAYIENHTYSNKIVSARYSDADANTSEKLLEAGQKELAKRCCPQASYECDVIDLSKALDMKDGSKYDFMKFELFSIITLLDVDHHTRINHRIAEYKRYPNLPQKNSVTLSTVPAQIQDDIHKAQSNADEAQITAGDAKSTADATHIETTKLADEMENKVSTKDFSTLLRQSTTDILMAFNSTMGNSGIDFSSAGIDFSANGSAIGNLSTN
ncbi:MAG: phage tail protein, partial [Oscillospiraceae bacterium]|nr:phage tail protein [Oscillospiraceae bacterium]